MPPPLKAVLPVMMELLMVRLPRLLKAPPLPEILAPETVTPEIIRTPPVLILKILKLRLGSPPFSPLMLREEAPRPLIVKVPAVPPVTAEDASLMLGRIEFRVIVIC